MDPDEGGIFEELPGNELILDVPADDDGIEEIELKTDDGAVADDGLPDWLPVDEAFADIDTDRDSEIFEEPSAIELLLDGPIEAVGIEETELGIEDVAVADDGLLDWLPVDETFADVDTLDTDSVDDILPDDLLTKELLGFTSADELFEDETSSDDEWTEDDAAELLSFDVLIADEDFEGVAPTDEDCFLEGPVDDWLADEELGDLVAAEELLEDEAWLKEAGIEEDLAGLLVRPADEDFADEDIDADDDFSAVLLATDAFSDTLPLMVELIDDDTLDDCSIERLAEEDWAPVDERPVEEVAFDEDIVADDIADGSADELILDDTLEDDGTFEDGTDGDGELDEAFIVVLAPDELPATDDFPVPLEELCADLVDADEGFTASLVIDEAFEDVLAIDLPAPEEAILDDDGFTVLACADEDPAPLLTVEELFVKEMLPEEELATVVFEDPLSVLELPDDEIEAEELLGAVLLEDTGLDDEAYTEELGIDELALDESCIEDDIGFVEETEVEPDSFEVALDEADAPDCVDRCFEVLAADEPVEIAFDVALDWLEEAEEGDPAGFEIELEALLDDGLAEELTELAFEETAELLGGWLEEVTEEALDALVEEEVSVETLGLVFDDAPDEAALDETAAEDALCGAFDEAVDDLVSFDDASVEDDLPELWAALLPDEAGLEDVDTNDDLAVGFVMAVVDEAFEDVFGEALGALEEAFEDDALKVALEDSLKDALEEAIGEALEEAF